MSIFMTGIVVMYLASAMVLTLCAWKAPVLDFSA
jgi:hypothetical protein